LCVDAAPFFSRIVSSPLRWLTTNRGSIPIKEKRPDSSFRSADSKRNENFPRPIFCSAPTGVSTSLTISATTGTKFPRSASWRNSSSEGEIMVIPSEVEGSREVTLQVSLRDSSTNARNDHCRSVYGKHLFSTAKV